MAEPISETKILQKFRKIKKNKKNKNINPMPDIGI